MAELLTLKELQEENPLFVVPSYQRGYRWRREEVEELLNDLLEAHRNNKNYFLQPLFIAEDKETKRIIDGQQRLTTLYIILKALGVEPEFSIEYEIRKGSKEFLQKIEEKDQKEAHENPDYYFMWQAYETASSKLSKLGEDEREEFKNFLLSMLQFLLYRVEKEEEIEVFVRLNSGRIPLTDAELIRAYLLKKENFKGEEKERRQIEMGKEWETVEREFQEDSFFYFLSPKDYQTRMDLLFEVFLKKKKGTNYKLFREFKSKFKERVDSAKEVWELWQEVKKAFYTLKLWHRDDELYHTLGILFSTGEHPINFAKKVEGKKRSEVKREAMEELKEKLYGKEWKEIKITELSYGDQRVKLALTTFNVSIYSKRGLRFPFHAFNREEWSIEHIHPQKDAEVKERALKDWICEELNWLLKVKPESKEELEDLLKGVKLTLSEEGVELENCKKALPSGSELENLKEELIKKVDKLFGNSDSLKFIEEDNKNSIGNLTLLTKKQNSKLSNHTFPFKREKLLKLEEEGEFVLLGTEEVFLKRYSDEKGLSHPFVWSNEDAEKYAKALEEKIREFLGVKGGERREKN